MDRFTLLLDQYQRLDTVNGGVLLTVAALAVVGILIDQLATGRTRRTLLGIFTGLVLVCNFALLGFAGLLNGM